MVLLGFYEKTEAPVAFLALLQRGDRSIRLNCVAERLDGRQKRRHEMEIDDLPNGAFVAMNNAAFAVQGSHLLRWSENGYREKIARPRVIASVLTPPSIVAVLSAGYQPQWHPSAH